MSQHWAEDRDLSQVALVPGRTHHKDGRPTSPTDGYAGFDNQAGDHTAHYALLPRNLDTVLAPPRHPKLNLAGTENLALSV